MARGETSETDAAHDEEKTLLNRRSYLQVAAAAVGAVASSGLAAAASSDYDVIKIPAHTTKRITIGSGETFENVLIDQTEPGAMAQIRATGSGWTFRNVGLKGKVTDRDGQDTAVFLPEVSSGGTGLIENVYMGDGTDGPNGINGFWVPFDHAGTLVIRNLNIGYWADNAVYASDPGNGGSMGEVHIEQSYAHNNNISGFRIGTPGSYIKDSVVNNTGDHPAYSNGARNARGIWGKEQSGLKAVNCDIYNPSGITVQAGDQGEIALENCRLDGTLVEKSDGTISGSSTGSPDPAPPSGVPMTPEEAASGQSSGGSGGTDDGTSDGGSGGDSSDFPNHLVVETREGGPLVEYEIVVDGEVRKSENAEQNDGLRVTDGETTIVGATGNGYTDSFTFNGSVLDWSANVGSEHYTILVNGEPLTRSEPTEPEPTDHTLEVLTHEGGPLVEYEFTVSGDVTKGENAEQNDGLRPADGGGTTVVGATGNGYTDDFTFTGEFQGWSANVDSSNYVVVVDGDVLDVGTSEPAPDPEPVERTLTVATREGGPLVEYEFTVDGDVTKGADADGNDSLTAANGQTHVVGATGNGYTDNYTIVGDVSGWSANVDAQHYTVTIDGQEVTL